MEAIQLLEWGIRSSVAIALVGIVLFFGGKYFTPKTRFNIWFGSLIAVGGLIFAMNWLPEFRILNVRIPTSSILSVEAGDMNQLYDGTVNAGDLLETNSAFDSKADADRSAGIMPWWIVLWCGGVMLFLGRLGASFFFLSRNHQVVSKDHPGLNLCETLRKEIEFSSPVQLVEGEGSAMTWGIVHPKIFLPKTASQWPTEHLEMVLRHEIAHLKRRDPLWLVLSQIVAAVAWFHPGIWIVAKRLGIEREKATDESVLAQGILPSSYATAILELSASSEKSRAGVPSVALCGMGAPENSESEVEERIKRVLGSRHGEKGKIATGLSFLLCGLIILGGVLAFVSSQKKALPGMVDSPVTIVIDAGHGSHDTGGKNGNTLEKNLNLDISKRVEKRLRAAGAKVVMTRNSDEFMTLGQRIEIANQNELAVMVSIHCNSHRDSNVKGIECYTGGLISEANAMSEELGAILLRHTVAETGANDHELKKKSLLKFFRSRTVPTVLIECGFVTHPDEVKDLTDPNYREKLAVGIVNGVIEFLSTNDLSNLPTVPVVGPSLTPKTNLATKSTQDIQDPSELWYQGYLVFKKADEQENAGERLNALNLYNEAEVIFDRLSQEFPSFHPELVEHRLRILSSRLVEQEARTRIDAEPE